MFSSWKGLVLENSYVVVADLRLSIWNDPNQPCRVSVLLEEQSGREKPEHVLTKKFGDPRTDSKCRQVLKNSVPLPAFPRSALTTSTMWMDLVRIVSIDKIHPSTGRCDVMSTYAHRVTTAIKLGQTRYFSSFSQYHRIINVYTVQQKTKHVHPSSESQH